MSILSTQILGQWARWKNLMQINGLHSETAECVAHRSHVQDTIMIMAGRHGRDHWPSKLAMEIQQISNSNMGISLTSWGPFLNMNREQTAHLLRRAEFNDECIPDTFERVHSGNTYLKSRKWCVKIGMRNVQTLYQVG